MSEAETPDTATAAAATRSRRERKRLAWQGKACQNCNVPLRGPFCHQCGQPEKTPIRDLVSLSTDAFDYLFDVDARVWRTLVSLFFRPGRLTEAYLRGKRMSFVRPMRIYLVMSALLFVVVSSTTEMNMNVSGDGDVSIGAGLADEGDKTAPADAPAAAAAGGAPAAPAPASAAAVPPPVPPSAPAPAAAAKPPAAPATGEDDPKKPINITFMGDEPWDREKNPLILSWLPPLGNDYLNDYIGIIKTNLQLARDDPKRLGHSFLRVLPQSLFVLLPIFALLLKLVMIFKRRMYMEHLMVAIHSHTFIYMGIIAAVGLSKIAERWPKDWTNPWWVLMGLAIAWIPLNLFLTQKRVYKQRWWGAPIGFLVISTLYLCLVGFTAVGALVMSLVTL